ncbi:MAG: WXG100 family type VII secretion target [Butyrivibrio sp.]
MKNTITVNTNNIYSAKEKIAVYKEDYKSSFEKIYSLSEEIFESGKWSGDDARMFNEKLQGFRNDFDALYRKLSDYCVYLQKAAETYDTTQTGIEKQANRLATDRK